MCSKYPVKFYICSLSIKRFHRYSELFYFRHVSKVGNALIYELRRLQEAMDPIFEDPEDTPVRHNCKLLYWHVKKLRGNGQSGRVPVRDRKGAPIRKMLVRDKARTF